MDQILLILIIKTIGIGSSGTVYLVKYKNKKYALKIQHILIEDTKKNMKSKIWKEIYFYNYINKLENKDKIFFVELYGYKIYDKCKHVQSVNINLNDKGKIRMVYKMVIRI